MRQFNITQGLWLLCLLLIPWGIRAQGSEWKKNNEPDYLRAMGVDPDLLEQFGKWNVEDNWGGTSMVPRSFLLAINETILGEWYADEYGNPLPEAEAKEEKVRLASAGKTYALVLLGILLDKHVELGLPEDFGPDSRLYDRRWLPEGFPLSDPLKSAITIDQVLRHTSGLMPESAGNDRGGQRSSIAFTLGGDVNPPLARRLYFEPGNPASYLPNSPYSSVAFNHLSIVFTNLTGKKADSLLEELVLAPMGIRDVAYSSSMEDREANWLSDGVKWFSSGGLWLKPRDHARLGMTIAMSGKWNNRQIVTQNWIHRLTRNGDYPDLLVNAPGFWTGQQIKGAGYRPLRPDIPEDLIVFGEPGVCVSYCIPSLGLTAVRTGRIVGVDWERQESEFLQRLIGLFGENLPVGLESGVSIMQGYGGDRSMAQQTY